MRILVLVFILILTRDCFGQNIKLVETETEKFYKLLEDSLIVNPNYPDGIYKVFKADTNKIPSQMFCLKNGKVDGPYLELGEWGWTYGTYFQDSRWTFLTAPNDTIYKVGTWRQYFNALGSGIQDIYKMLYDSNGIFTEVWLFYNGQKAREAIFKKGFGLEKETYWDFETNKISRQIINSGNGIYKQSITYKNDSVSTLSITQNGIQIYLNFDYEVYQNKRDVNIQVYTDNWNRIDLPITTLTIDSTKNLIDFHDVKQQIFLSKNNKGEISILYKTKKGKLKWKKLSPAVRDL